MATQIQTPASFCYASHSNNKYEQVVFRMLSASSTSSSTGPGSHATDNIGTSDESAIATRASSNTGGQTESFRDLIHFPSLSTMGSSRSSDIEI